MTSWTDSPNYDYAYAETSDPRVIAIIERDNDATEPPYDDGQAPTLYGYDYGSRANYTPVDRADTGIPDAYIKAIEVFDEDTAQRFLRIFYGVTAYHYIRSSHDQYSYAHVWDAPAWREHNGIPTPSTETPTPIVFTRDQLAGEQSAYLNGDVYGVGYAVNPARVTTETPIGIDPLNDPSFDWELTIECWGFYGDEYAKETAAEFTYGEPQLPAMLPID